MAEEPRYDEPREQRHAENCNTNRLRSNESDSAVCNCGAETTAKVRDVGSGEDAR